MPATPLRKTVLALALAALTAGTGCSQSVDQMIASGDEALGKGDYRTAEIQLKSALSKDPNSARARWLLGQMGLAVQDGASAEKEIRRAGELGVGPDATVPALAQALLLQGKTDAVLELEAPAGLSSRARGEVVAAHGLAQAATGNAGRADELTAEALKLAPDSPFAVTARVRVLAAANKPDEAEKLLAGLQQSHPHYGLAWSYAGDLHDQRGDLAKAEQAYTAAIEKKATPVQDRFKRAAVRLRQQNLDGALADAEPITKALPNYQPAWYTVGAARFQKKDFAGAQEALERSYQLNNDHVPTLILLGWANLAVGSQAQAAERAGRAVALAPNVVAARLLVATLELRQQQPQRAEEMVRPVVNALPDNLPAKSLLAASLQAQGRGAEAAPLLEQIAAAKPESLDVQTQVGLELLRAREPEKALAVLERAVAKAPDAPQANAALVAALLQDRKFDEALAAAQRFQQQNPKDVIALRLLGTAQLAKGDRDGAKTSFVKALEVAPGDPGASEELAALLAQAGDVAGARRHLDAAVAKHPTNWRLLYRLSELELRAGDKARSRELLERAVKADATAFAPRIALARTYLEGNQPAEALEVLSGLGDGDANIRLARAEAYFQLQRYADAKRLLEPLKAELPNSLPVYFWLAHVYAELGEGGALRGAVDRLVALSPGSTQAMLMKARLLIIDRHYGEARQLLDTVAAKGEPPSLAYLGTRLVLERSEGNTGKALEVAQAMHQQQPNTATVTVLADAQLRMGDTNAAEARLKEWVTVHPKDSVAGKMLSDLYLRTGKADQAMQLLRAMVAADPNNVSALNNLAWYSRESNPAAALEYAEKAYALAPDVAAVLDTYAELLARAGQKEKALRVIDRAVEVAAGNPAYRLRRAEINQLIGNRSQAIEELRALVGSDAPQPVKERAQLLLATWGG